MVTVAVVVVVVVAAVAVIVAIVVVAALVVALVALVALVARTVTRIKVTVIVWGKLKKYTLYRQSKKENTSSCTSIKNVFVGACSKLSGANRSSAVKSNDYNGAYCTDVCNAGVPHATKPFICTTPATAF